MTDERLGWVAENDDVTYAPAHTERLTACADPAIDGTIWFEYRAENKPSVDPLTGPAA